MGQIGRAGAIVALGALAVLGGCGEQSRVDPDQAIVVTGTVEAPGGGPARGRPVQLGVGVTPADGAFAVLTLGLHCTTGACSGAIRDAVTDERGAFRFDLEGRDTQSTFGAAEPVLVSATGPPADGQVSGPLASARFRAQASEVRLPALTMVDPRLRVDGGGVVAVRWEPVAPGPYELWFEAGDAAPVWRVRTDEGTATLDPRFLEDTSGRVVVSGGSEATIEGSTVALGWRSGGVPYASVVGPPPSRGRPCRSVGASGTVSGPSSRCGLTDGDLHGTAAVDDVCGDGTQGACEAAVAAEVDLGAPTPAELVVVRGCEGGCAVDVSADGTSYRPAGSVADAFGAVPLDGAPITAVRVGLGGPSRLREVSIWGPAPTSALRPVGEDARSAIAAPYRPEDDAADPPLVLALGAGAAILATAVAGAFVLGRRSTPGSGTPSTSSRTT